MKKEEKKKPLGRPSIYTGELIAEICKRLMKGESLRKICKDDAMPNIDTVCDWLSKPEKYPNFSVQYARAREIQAEILADEIIDISDDGTNDTYRDSEGNSRTDHENIQRSRLRVDSRKWVAVKLLPKKYGDKIKVEDDSPRQITVKYVKP